MKKEEYMDNFSRKTHWNSRATWNDLAMVPSSWAVSMVRQVLREQKLGLKDSIIYVNKLAQQENLKIVNRVVNNIIGSLSNLGDKEIESLAIRVLEVSTGVGSLTEELLPQVVEKGWRYTGIDCAPQMVKKTRDRILKKNKTNNQLWSLSVGLATHIFDLIDVPFHVITWGKVGLHLVGKMSNGLSEWEEGINQIKKALAIKGIFVLYEALLDDNPQYASKSKSKKWTQFRTFHDYVKQLYPLELIKVEKIHFCNEVYTIAIFKRPS